MIDLIYVGLEKPVKEKFQPVKNVGGTKPLEDKGFWVSPMCEDGKSYWQHWLENYHNRDLSDELKHWHIVMEPETRILEADMGLYNIRPYLMKGKIGFIPYVIDYEKMSKDYDFLYVPDKVQKKHRMGVFMGFDVPTGLFLNPTFRALDDKEFEEFKEKQEQRQREDVALLEDPFIVKMLMALNNNEISETQAKEVLARKLQEIRRGKD